MFVGGDPLEERPGQRVRVAVGRYDVGHCLLLERVADDVVVDRVEREVRDRWGHVGGGERLEQVLHVVDAGGPGHLPQPQPGGPGMADEGGAGVDGQRAHGDDRLDVRVGWRDLGGDRVDHQREHLGLVGDVVVQRHDLVAEFGGELAHREGVGAVLVGEGDRSGDDRRPIEGVAFGHGRFHP